jgi:NAD(P)-dependent dehydrogenase (short-subunit alcohol dehydrogenase family)
MPNRLCSQKTRQRRERVVETDFWGAANLSLQAIRVFRDENPKTGQQGGVVLNVTSLGGFAGFPGSAYYHAAKFALEGFTESISKEARPEWNIHFSLIEPGSTKTRFATSASMEWLSPHVAYTAADTPTRLLEGYVKNPDMQRTWTPAERVAASMYQLVARKGKPLPMRLPLTSGAWQIIKAEVASVDKELDEVRELSESVEIDDSNADGKFLSEIFK